MTFVKPRPVARGASVAVVAPAGGFPRDAFDVGLQVLTERYQPHHEDGLFDQFRYLAGREDRRVRELQHALSDDSKRAVFAARGGYGTMHLLRRLNWDPRWAKPIVGFSDLTALHCAAQTNGWVSIHGPVLTQLGKQPAPVRERLFQLLERPEPPPPLDGKETFVRGVAEGVLLGGNLSVFASLMGTPYMPKLEGAVLLLEDVGERPYRLDRMWTQLELGGVFSQIAGLVLGDFTGCEEPNATYSSTDVLQDLAARARVPCAFGFPIGHGELNFPVPLGTKVRLDAEARRLHFLEGAVAEEPAV